MNQRLCYPCTFRSDEDCDGFGPLNIPLTRVRRFLKSLSGTRLVIAVIVLVALMGLIVFLGVFPASFVYVEYHEVSKNFIIRQKINTCVFQVSAQKKTRYGRLTLSHYFVEIFYIEIAIFTTFSPIFAHI